MREGIAPARPPVDCRPFTRPLADAEPRRRRARGGKTPSSPVPTIELHTSIAAPLERVFDLCRSVDAHVASAGATGERPVGGVTSGLLGLGDRVTWSARHLGWRWRLTSEITGFDRPRYFRDSMVAGVFLRFDHDHEFVARGATTFVRDVFDFTSPWGPLGRIADALVVTRHMRRFLMQRMQQVQRIAESAEWQHFLGEGSSGSLPAGRFVERPDPLS